MLLARAHGRRELLDEEGGLPLGVDPDARYRTAAADLEPGDVLLLYTDGLVESRDRPIEHGIERLKEAVDPSNDLEVLLNAAVERLLGEEARSDDTAVVAVRLPARLAPLELELPLTLPSLVELRETLGPWLRRAGANEAEARELVVATWEAVANSLEHAQDPSEPRVRVRGRRLNGGITVSVADSGRWREPVPAADRGLGLELMRGLVTELEIDRGRRGTTVHLKRALEASET
jgi:anti-sigma regulatory factor (Ser/Thr protein kinase)